MTGGLSTTKFSYESLKKKPTKLPWIPSGSFSDAIMIEGADANASVTGQQNTQPVTIRLLGNIQMPNNKEYSADGCFVVGEIWGDISSERGIVRTKSLSCVLKNGKHVDMEFDGHVSYQGKGGVRGKPVMRNGMIVGYAGAAGLLSGFGEGIKSAATPSVGLGATADNAGCGGIDAYLGSFSMISGEEIQRFVKQIMSNAAGYAFDLALQTMVPELKQAKDFLQKLASDVNSMNMSSCQAAQGIIGGLWPVTQVSQQKICQDIAGETNMFSDWAASRQGCTVGGQGDKVTAKAGDAEKDQVLKNKNLIWDTLSKNGLLGNDRALKELVMSTVGSIIFNKNGDVTILTPLVDNRDLIKVLMRGGTAKVYGCDESDLCLGPVVTNLTISESNALVTLVKNLMLSMQNKLVDDTALTDQEKGFVNTTSVPVLKYLTNAQSMGMSATYLLQVSDFIAQDLMIQYLQELVKQASLSLAGKNFPEEAAAKLRDNIIHAQGLLADMKLQSAADQNALDGIDRNMQYLQQQVSTIVSGSYQSNYHWGDR
ncbi:TPA: conjugal transfer pilus assembly protein TraH [Citrobacter freundii]